MIAEYYVDTGEMIVREPTIEEVEEFENSRADARKLAFFFLRNERNARLMSSDWTQMPDTNVDQAAWAEYRQALRDLPENTVDPENPVWPTPPA